MERKVSHLLAALCAAALVLAAASPALPQAGQLRLLDIRPSLR
jgi:hypothetical protein